LPETRPKRKDEIQCRKVGDEWLLYDSKTGTIHVINATAELVWRMCDGAHSVDDMAKAVGDAFETPEEVDARQDIEEVLRSFSDKGVLES